MVREYRVNDLAVFFILLGYISADGNVRTLDLVVYGLTDIVKQSGALCESYVRAELRPIKPAI